MWLNCIKIKLNNSLINFFFFIKIEPLIVHYNLISLNEFILCIYILTFETITSTWNTFCQNWHVINHSTISGAFSCNSQFWKPFKIINRIFRNWRPGVRPGKSEYVINWSMHFHLACKYKNANEFALKIIEAKHCSTLFETNLSLTSIFLFWNINYVFNPYSSGCNFSRVSTQRASLTGRKEGRKIFRETL